MASFSKLAKVALFSPLVIFALYYLQTKNGRTPAPRQTSSDTTGPKKEKVAVDAVFFARLGKILKILFPSVLSKETFFTILAAVMMFSRTYCDLWMISKSTSIERIIISRKPDEFFYGLLEFLVSCIPIALVNNLLKYSLEELNLLFRTRLTEHVYKDYLKGFTYYKINNLDNRISNPDQLLTQDLDKFCRGIVDLYSNISKPIVDMFIYAYKLTGAIGLQGPSIMLGYLMLSGVVLTALRRPIGRFTVQEQQLEGEYRYVNSRLITNSEEIAFYQGNQKEKTVIGNTFSRLVAHLRKSMHFRFSLGVLDHFVAKYLATCVGFYVVSRPFLNLQDARINSMDQNEIMEDYYKSGRMLLNMATAVGRLVLAGRELTRLAGFTARMSELMGVLKDLNEGRYTRTMVNTSDSSSSSSVPLIPGAGQIIEQDHLIRFEDVPVVTPNGDILIKSLSFEVKSGVNVLVCGPNGCGKSSLFRILGELWPIFGGKLYKPAKEKLFYVPQRPYMTIGTLRDQVIYPHNVGDLRRKGLSDKDLLDMLNMVQLSYLAEREGGFDSVQDWMDVLSGGEKQRIAMARLFYHRPQFSILDECTSAVSADVEGLIYTQCRTLGITLFTVSHRKSLWAYHDYVLRFDGHGDYEFVQLTADMTPFGS